MIGNCARVFFSSTIDFHYFFLCKSQIEMILRFNFLAFGRTKKMRRKNNFESIAKLVFEAFFFERKSFSQLYQTLNNVKSNIVWQMKIMLWWRTHQVSSLNALEIASYKNMLWKGNKTCFEYLSLYARRMKRKRFSTSSNIHTFRFIL